MKQIVIDLETEDFTNSKGRRDPSPYWKTNRLVSAGWAWISEDSIGPVTYRFFAHSEGVTDAQLAFNELQAELDKAELLIAHNAKFDLQWLKEAGFVYNGPVYDTMIGEYVLARGQKWDLTLAASCIRRECSPKKKDLVQEHWDNGLTFYEIPKELIEEYGVGDVVSCGELYLSHCSLYSSDENKGLRPTLDLMNEFCVVLTDMERTGIKIDLAELDRVEVEYKAEKEKLEVELRELVHEFMGDTPVNLASPEQLSQVIYSRRVIDKHQWAETFNLGTNARGKPLQRPRLSNSQFIAAIRRGTEIVRKTKAIRCDSCGGSGKIQKQKRDGSPFKNSSRCTACQGEGVNYLDLTSAAGLRCTPPGVAGVSAGGFSTDADTIRALLTQCASSTSAVPPVRSEPSTVSAVSSAGDQSASEPSATATGLEPRLQSRQSAEAASERGTGGILQTGDTAKVRFLKNILRLSAIDTYLSSFIDGLRRGCRGSDVSHAKFNQCVTSTGRLSSSEPNFQNLPRNATFPVRRAIISRWGSGAGKLVEGDFAQLEFRVAGELAHDRQVLADLLANKDVHKFTAEVLSKAGQPTDRQEAKAHSFKPLFGGTSGTVAEQTYYKAFLDTYKDIKEWHERLLDQAVREGIIRIPSGREYAFPHAKRNFYGGVTGGTQIKNYGVQGFATADLAPIAAISFVRSLHEYKLRSVLCNLVHDSLLADCLDEEVELVCKLMQDAMLGVIQECKRRYDYDFEMPLAIEIKVGTNWGNGVKI